jgi:DNA-directed RNA polymerase sigma subunit (sigma70/sigma32)
MRSAGKEVTGKMQDKMIFREKLGQIKALADEQDASLTVEEINRFFEEGSLTNEQLTMVYDYLIGQKIHVEGYEKEGASKEHAPEEQENSYLTEEECMQMYLEELEEIEGVSEEEEEKLFLLAAAGDQTAQNRLLELSLEMVCEVAHTYAYSDMPQSDLVQEGNIGLMMALKDMEIMDSLSDYRNYLYQAVSEAMEQAASSREDDHELDEQIVERVNHLNESIQNLERDLEHKVSVSELSAYLEMPIEEIRDILRMAGDEIDIIGT